MRKNFKGLEIFGSRVFTQIRPVWKLGKKVQNFDGLGLKITVLSPTSLSNFKRCGRRR